MEVVKKACDTVLYWALTVLFAALVLTTVWQVFGRLVLSSPVTWSEELAKIIFVWLSFLGAAFLFGERGHIAVDFVARKFNESVQRGIALVIQLLIIVFAALALVWGGTTATISTWPQNLTALPLSIGNVYLVIPLTGVLIVYYSLVHFVNIWTGAEEPFPEVEDEAETGSLAGADGADGAGGAGGTEAGETGNDSAIDFVSDDAQTSGGKK